MCSFLLILALQVVKFLLHGEQRIISLFRCRERSIVASFLVSQRSPTPSIPSTKPDIGFGKPDSRVDWIWSNPPALMASMTLQLEDDIGVHRVSSLGQFDQIP